MKVTSHIRVVADLFNFNLNARNNKLISSFFEDSSVEAICRLQPLVRDQEDGQIWVPNERGLFSVKSAYYLIKQVSRPSSILVEHGWRCIWKLQIQNRLKLFFSFFFFLWRCASGPFPFRGKIVEMTECGIRMLVSALCSNFAENGQHIFFCCHVAKTLWRESPWPLDVEGLLGESLASLIRMLSQPHSLFCVPINAEWDFTINTAVFLDTIWFQRNKVINLHLDLNVQEMISMIHCRYFEHLQAWCNLTISSARQCPP